MGSSGTRTRAQRTRVFLEGAATFPAPSSGPTSRPSPRAKNGSPPRSGRGPTAGGPSRAGTTSSRGPGRGARRPARGVLSVATLDARLRERDAPKERAMSRRHRDAWCPARTAHAVPAGRAVRARHARRAKRVEQQLARDAAARAAPRELQELFVEFRRLVDLRARRPRSFSDLPLFSRRRTQRSSAPPPAPRTIHVAYLGRCRDDASFLTLLPRANRRPKNGLRRRPVDDLRCVGSPQEPADLALAVRLEVRDVLLVAPLVQVAS